MRKSTQPKKFHYLQTAKKDIVISKTYTYTKCPQLAVGTCDLLQTRIAWISLELRLPSVWSFHATPHVRLGSCQASMVSSHLLPYHWL